MSAPLSPTLWRTCRALANDKRLTILAILHEKGEMSVARMSQEVGCTPNKASEALRILNARGLLRARRSGRYVYYAIGADPAVRGADIILRGLLPRLRPRIHARRRAFKVLTGLTHYRRHQIVYDLSRNPMTFNELQKSVKVSKPALRRHLQKLRDRGLVAYRNRVYHLGKPRDLLRKSLLTLASNPP